MDSGDWSRRRKSIARRSQRVLSSPEVASTPHRPDYTSRRPESQREGQPKQAGRKIRTKNDPISGQKHGGEPSDTATTQKSVMSGDGHRMVKIEKPVKADLSQLFPSTRDSSSRPPASSILSSILQTPVKNSDSVWDHLRRCAPHITTVPDDKTIKELLLLPRVRDIRWRDVFEGNVYVRKDRLTLAMAIQITGEEPPKPCTGCRRGLGPYADCVVIPHTASAEAVHARWNCANCIFEGPSKVTCSLKTWSRSRITGTQSGVEDSPRTPQQKSGEGNNDNNGQSTRKRAATGSAKGRKIAQTPVSGRRGSISSALSGSGPRRGGPRVSSSGRPTTQRGSGDDVFMDDIDTPVRTSTTAVPLAPTPDHIPGNAVVAPAMLTMEEWETAPGHIRSTTAAEPDDIAFSRAYLSTNITVQVTSAVSVRVITLQAGTVMHLHLMSDADKTRAYSLITGKVHVRIGDEPEFAIGPQGLFVVKPGVAARVRNQLYIDCVLNAIVCQE